MLLGAEKNTLRLETSHLRGGHYVVSTDFRLIMKLSQVSRYVVAENEFEAERILMERGNLVISGVDPSIYANEWRIEPPAPRSGESATVRGLVHNDGEEQAVGWKLRFYEGDPARGGTVFAEKPLEPMEKGEFVEAAATWTAKPGGGKNGLLRSRCNRSAKGFPTSCASSEDAIRHLVSDTNANNDWCATNCLACTIGSSVTC